MEALTGETWNVNVHYIVTGLGGLGGSGGTGNEGKKPPGAEGRETQGRTGYGPGSFSGNSGNGALENQMAGMRNDLRNLSASLIVGFRDAVEQAVT